MKKPTTYLDKKFHYPVRDFPFAQLFVDRLNSVAPPSKHISELEKLHTKYEREEIAGLYQTLYAFVAEPEFQTLYREFIREYVFGVVGTTGSFQGRPGIRIHPPNGKTVQFHCDEWYGHGPDVINFWMPLTRAFSTNTLFAVPLERSIVEVEQLERQKVRIEEINGVLESAAHAIEGEPGMLFCFNSKTVHGSKTNTTDITRVSLDFRILPEGASPGTRPTSYFICAESNSLEKVNLKGKRAVVYIDSRFGLSRFFSPEQQRDLILKYSDQKGLVVTIDEIEIQTMSHHPLLHQCVEGKLENVVLMFSSCALPTDREERKILLEKTRKSGVLIAFAREQKIFPLEISESEIEAARKEVF